MNNVMDDVNRIMDVRQCAVDLEILGAKEQYDIIMGEFVRLLKELDQKLDALSGPEVDVMKVDVKKMIKGL